MSDPTPFKDLRIIVDEMVPMRDGIRLETTVFLPLGEGPFPTVLVRMAYDRRHFAGMAKDFTSRGMVLVAQDTRGRYGSEGNFYPFENEESDGLDTLDWLEQQPWCNGHVGMFGDSYLAAVQYAVIGSNHPTLKALNPRFMAGDCWRHGYYFDGVYSLGLSFSWLVLEVNSRVGHANLMPFYDMEAILRHLPLGTLDEKMGCQPSAAYRNLLRHPLPDVHWDTWKWREKFPRTTIPTLTTGGWYDYYAGEAFLNFEALRSSSEPDVAASHRLIIGPWTHGITGGSELGEWDFGPESVKENTHHVRWVDCLLKGGQPSEFQEAPIRLFVMGENRWRDEWEWPLARTQWTPYYLGGNGALGQEIPCRQETDTYTYDPANPVPTTGGNHSVGPYNPGLYEICRPGPFEQSRVEMRDDVLVYTTPPLEHDVEVTGPVTMILYAASSAPDTDWVGRLCDVYPDGKSFNITEGVVRAAFREQDWLHPKPLEPGQVYEYTIDLQATSYLFKAGHRIRVQVTSSNFPLWARNLNTGEPYETAVEMRPAQQTIYHDESYPSHILLPVIPR